MSGEIRFERRREMINHIIRLSMLLLLCLLTAVPARAASIPIENASFEAPVVDPNGFGAVPLVDGWTEMDIDTMFSTNTGVFANTDPNSFDHIVNADGSQLAFLGSQAGNAMEQDLADTYKVGCEYQLTVGVSVSSRFPPSAAEPIDTLELALYYRDANDVVVDIAIQTVEATGQSYTQLQDFSLELPTVQSGDVWMGKPIGIALRAAGQPGGFWDLDNVRLIESPPVLIPIVNASFEAPVVDPNGFGAVPLVDGWTEMDIDTMFSTNTGVFANTDPNSFDHIVNADGSQLAFLGSQTGNALEQDLDAVYTAGFSYVLTVGVSVSSRFPPSAAEPVDTLELALYYRDANDVVVDIAIQTVEATGQSYTQLQDFSLELPTVQSGDVWTGKPIGIALRAAGQPGGFWDLDNVRLIELPPVLIPIVNASFEAPVVDPNGFGAVPLVDGWTEMDIDTLFSANTGVFANTDPNSFDHIVNADGNQLAFLGSQAGNALEQDLAATYKVGFGYRLTVAVSVSSRFPPAAVEPVDTLDLALYYRDANDVVVDIAIQTVEAAGQSYTQLQDFSLELPAVQSGDAWAGKAIGIALRAAGQPGGFWDLDNVRLIESPPDPDIALTVKE